MLPYSKTVPVEKLAGCFRSVTASYKFFWFLSILHLQQENPSRTRFTSREIALRMLAEAYYPIKRFRLSFGMQDNIQKILKNFDVDVFKGQKREVIGKLSEQEEKVINDSVRALVRYVPYAFLSPWTKGRVRTEDTKKVIQFSQEDPGVLYKIIPGERGSFEIEINPRWCPYLQEHFRILKEFVQWNLAEFLSSKNPNTPNIVFKLQKPENRVSLDQQRKYWDVYIKNTGGSIPGLYSSPAITPETAYDLDHFIPWSFVAHNLIWNLYPVDSSLNRSKGDQVPDLKELDLLAFQQQRALSFHLEKDPKNKLLQDFETLGYEPRQLARMDGESFYEVFKDTFSPMAQSALNMGFQRWDPTKESGLEPEVQARG